MDLNWCPVCEQHIPLAWESSLYCSDRCKKIDAMANASTQPQYNLPTSPSSSPLLMPAFVSSSVSPSSTSSSSSASSTYNYLSPPTSPMSQYIYNKTSSSGRISPPSFSLGHPAATTSPSAFAASGDYLEYRRKSNTPYQLSTVSTTTAPTSAKKNFLW